jgi:hypothetical protein
VDAVVDRVDVNEVVQRIDVDSLVEQTDLGSVIAKSSSGVASDVLDVVRSRTVGVDEFIARWVARLRRRPYTGPPGPVSGPPGGARTGESPSAGLPPAEVRLDGLPPDDLKARTQP